MTYLNWLGLLSVTFDYVKNMAKSKQWSKNLREDTIALRQGRHYNVQCTNIYFCMMVMRICNNNNNNAKKVLMV